MLTDLTESVRETIQSAARKLTGFRRRQFQAEMAIKYCGSNARRAELVEEIHALVEPESQADPKFQTPLAYTRITAKAVHERLVATTAGNGRHVPAERTVYDILNRLGYRLRRVQKTKPQKKSLKPTPSSTTCGKSTRRPPKPRKRSASRSTPRRR
jgi:hypothetical protein